MTRSIAPWRFWVAALVALILILWALSGMLLPFVAGLTIAYFLNPVVNVLARRKVPRWIGAFAVIGLFALAVVLLLMLVAPLIQSQVGALLHALPDYIEAARQRVLPWAEGWLERLSPDDMERLRGAASDYAGTAVSWTGKLVTGIVSRGFGILDIIPVLTITPFVAFLMLRDWPRLVHTVDRLIPRRHHRTVREQMRAIDKTLSGFVRGQALVCLALGIMYGTGFTLAGLKYGVTIGVIAGVLSFIPYVGSAFALVSSTVLALAQYGDITHALFMLGVFAVGQTLEGYVLTPKLVGDRVGLHPVWILFALFAGGHLMGFTGILIAVPVAAIAGVLLRFALGRYKASGLYKDKEGHAP